MRQSLQFVVDVGDAINFFAGFEVVERFAPTFGLGLVLRVGFGGLRAPRVGIAKRPVFIKGPPMVAIN